MDESWLSAGGLLGATQLGPSFGQILRILRSRAGEVLIIM